MSAVRRPRRVVESQSAVTPTSAGTDRQTFEIRALCFPRFPALAAVLAASGRVPPRSCAPGGSDRTPVLRRAQLPSLGPVEAGTEPREPVNGVRQPSVSISMGARPAQEAGGSFYFTN